MKLERGTACTVRIDPAKGRPYNCRVQVQCAERKLFGTTSTNGYAHCQVDSGVATEAHEAAPDDSDPDIHYDAATGRIIIKDHQWQLDLQLE